MLEWSLLLHTALGIAALLPLAWYSAVHWADYRRYQMSPVVLLGYVAAAGLLTCLVSGAVVTWQGLAGLRMSPAWRQAHLISTFVAIGGALPHVVLLLIRVARLIPASIKYVVHSSVMGSAGIAITALLPFAYAGTSYDDVFPADYHYISGKERPFAPSLAKTSTGGAFDARVLAGSRSCGTARCHTEIVNEWLPSAHRYAAMDPLFQGIQQTMATQNGPESTRYCGGCHDPISLFSGTKNIFVKDLTGLQGYQEGVSCLACHSIRETDLKGNASYTMSRPSEYLWQWQSAGPGRLARDFLIRTYPDEHNRMSKRLFKTPQYCAACHKQFIDAEVNRVGWVQLQNQYDNWANSHWNHKGDPRKTVECRECHMPLVASNDPSSGDSADYNRTPGDRRHRSHRFIAANQLVPALKKLEGWEEQVRLTEEWLQGKRRGQMAEWSDRQDQTRSWDIQASRRHSNSRRTDVQQGGTRLPDRPARHDSELGGDARRRLHRARDLFVRHARCAELHRTRHVSVQGRAGRSARKSDRPAQPVGDGRCAVSPCALSGLLRHGGVSSPVFGRDHGGCPSAAGRRRSSAFRNSATNPGRPLYGHCEPQISQGRSVSRQLPDGSGVGHQRASDRD
jgi:cytochrome c554/c'-like protein